MEKETYQDHWRLHFAGTQGAVKEVQVCPPTLAILHRHYQDHRIMRKKVASVKKIIKTTIRKMRSFYRTFALNGKWKKIKRETM